MDKLEKPDSVPEKSVDQNTKALRLQAYERLLLFIERTNPVNLLVRLNDPNYLASKLHYQVLTEIRNEFQHNITQQLYVSTSSWEIAKRIKNDTIALANSAIKVLPPHASGFDFSKLILEQMSKMENNPYDVAASLIRDDAQQLFLTLAGIKTALLISIYKKACCYVKYADCFNRILFA